MKQVRESRYVRSATASLCAAASAARRTSVFYNARNGINVKLTREEERAALLRMK